VCLIEARRIGSGASGRSGGQLLCAFEDDSELIAGVAGDDVARTMVQDSIKLGTERTVELIQKYGIDCMHTKTNHVLSCCFAKGPAKRGQTIDEAVQDANAHLGEWFTRFGEKWSARTDLPDMGFVSERFAYATQSTEGSELNPMSMCFGLARVVEQLGGTIYENSPVATVRRPTTSGTDDSAAPPVVVTTDNGGVVRARDVVLATGSAPASISKALAACTTKMTTGIFVTKPYPDPSKIAAVLKPSVVVFDERYFMNYFRVVGDNNDRILFGGLGCALPQSDEAILDELVPEFHKTFPSLMPDFAVDYVWQGQMNMRYPACPLVGREGDGNSPAGGGRRMWYSLAFGGHGLAPAAAAGSLIAAAIVDEQAATASPLGHTNANARDHLTRWQQYTHVPAGLRGVVPSLPLFGTWVGCLGVDVTAMKLRWEDHFAGRCD
jgi:glycine/D-amino acid oxidase-like deaminating enzyme